MGHFVCTTCGETAPLTNLEYKCHCGGLYKLEKEIPVYDSRLIDTSTWNIFRYRAFMPLDNPLWQQVTLGEGMTAVVPYKEDVFFKLDYAMPTLSFKDRGAAAIIWLCKTIGVEKVIQDSSGNAGNSVAAYCAHTGIECEIVVPKGTSPKKIAMIEAHGATCTIFDGTRDEAADACREKAAREGIYYANHVYNPMFYEGTKTYIYETFEQLGRIPGNLFIPVGNGTLLLGCEQALVHLYESGAIDKLPHIYIVQSERCAPLYGAKDEPRAVTPESTYAEGIAIGKPMRGRLILGSQYPGGRTVVTAPEEGILPARQAMAKAGFFVEHTTAATFAAYQALTKNTALEGDVLLPLCGAGLKSEK